MSDVIEIEEERNMLRVNLHYGFISFPISIKKILDEQIKINMSNIQHILLCSTLNQENLLNHLIDNAEQLLLTQNSLLKKCSEAANSLSKIDLDIDSMVVHDFASADLNRILGKVEKKKGSSTIDKDVGNKKNSFYDVSN